jgi:hypothetical protein
VLIRRSVSALRDGEPIPPVLPAAVRDLGDAVGLLRQELARGVEPIAARERALRAAADSGAAYEQGVGFSGGVVVAQVRSTVVDLLRASGLEHAEAVPLVRRAYGWRRRSGRGRRPATGDEPPRSGER